MSSFLSPPDAPITELAKPRILSPNAGVKVSPLCLGAMSIGEKWKDFMGAMDKEQSFKLLDAFWEAGGNFIDTASNYQDEDSEKFIGEWAEARGIRDQLVIATKYTTQYRGWELGKSYKTINYAGNNKKTMQISVDASLQKLRTHYIDILYVHWWEYTTSIKEMMDGLHNLVQSGKVLYLGISDTPAWIVAAAQQYALDNGKTPFAIYQGRWNVMIRDMERDILPMARNFGLALAPWDVLGGGRLQSKKAIEERQKRGENLRTFTGDRSQTETEEKMSAALEKIGAEHGIESVTAVALAYILQKSPYVFPIIGGRKVDHLYDNIKALSIKLSDEQIKYIENVVPFEKGFPLNFVGEDPFWSDEQGFMSSQNANLQFVKGPKAIGHQ